jgi:hypothetical protein
LAELQAGATAVGQIVNRTFTVAAASVTGFVTAGIAASGMGQTLTLQMGMLSRAIAGLFGPEIRAVINGLNQLVTWFQNLSESQRDLIGRILLGAAAFKAVTMIMPMFIGAIASAVKGVIALTGAVIGFDVASGGILPIIGAIVTGLTALAIGTKVGRDGLTGFIGAIGPGLKMLADLGSKLGTIFAPLQSDLLAVSDALGDMMKRVGPELIAGTLAVAKELVPILKAIGELFVMLAPLMSEMLVESLKGLAISLWLVLQPLAAISDVLSAVVKNINGLLGIRHPDSERQPRTGTGSLMPNVGNFSGDLTASYFSASSALLAASQARTGNPAEDQLRATQRTNEILENIETGINRQQPDVVRR